MGPAPIRRPTPVTDPSPTTTPDAATRRAGTTTLAAGLAVVIATSLAGGADAPLSALAFAAWAIAPYALLWTLSRLTGTAWIVGGAGLAAVVLEIAVRLTVFVVPRGSTAAVALVFSPIAITVVAMPVGGALGWLAGRLWPRGPAVRASVTLAAAAVATWIVVGVAWPDQLPTARLARRRALEAIGSPRVVAGGPAWTWRPIEGAAAWPMAVDLDGDGDDDLATVGGGVLEVRRLPSLESIARHPLGQPSAWSWYSRVVRLGGGLAIVATGGGFQETWVGDLDGTERWRYHPDASLPPTSLRPADLDGDGATEFYATTATALVRLDDGGREVWRRDVAQLYPLGTLAPSAGVPGLVAAAEYRGTVHVWQADGTPVAQLPWPADAMPLRLADWMDGRVLLLTATDCDAPPGCAARAVGLDGRERWRIDAPPHMRAIDVMTIAPAPAVPLLRVVVAAASRDVGRARLQILDAADRIVYDEVFAETPRVTVARRRAGDVLVVQDGERMRLLTPAPGATPAPADSRGVDGAVR